MNLKKKVNYNYCTALNNPSTTEEVRTRLYNNKVKAHKRARAAANNSLKVNRRVKEGYFDTINSTMNNNNIIAKIFFSIFIKLMNSQKYSKIPLLLEKDKIIMIVIKRVIY